MRADKLAVLALLALLAPSSLWAGVKEADAAFDAGNNARALALYDEVLAETPGDVHALVRSGKLLSWDRRFDEALARYDRVLAIDPAQPEARLERAKVFLWSKRYTEAREAFGAILAADPGHKDARLALARAYSWDGRQAEARAEYQRVLDGHPNDPEALLGVAQTYAWSGNGTAARPYFEKALAAKPGMKEAEIGLAYADLDAGDTSAAHARARTLSQAHPDDAEVRDLETAVRKARAPWISVGGDHIGDTDDNRLDTLRVEGGFGLPARLDLRFGITASALEGPVAASPDGEGDAASIYAVLGWKPRPKHRGELRVGAARLTDSVDRERTTALLGLTYAFPFAGTWTGRAAAAHDPFLYSPAILDAEIDVTSVSFSVAGRAAPRVQVDASAAYGDFSDGNVRLHGEAGGWYVWVRGRTTTLGGGVVRVMRFSDDLDNGYFDPQRFLAPVGSVRSYGSMGGSKWTYDATLEAGVQTFEVNGEQASSEPLVNLNGLVGRPISRAVGFESYAAWSNSSTAAGPDFRSLAFGVRFRFTIGG